MTSPIQLLTGGTQHHQTQPKSSLSSIYAKFGVNFLILRNKILTTHSWEISTGKFFELQYKQHGEVKLDDEGGRVEETFRGQIVSF